MDALFGRLKVGLYNRLPVHKPSKTAPYDRLPAAVKTAISTQCMGINPVYDFVRADPRFIQLLSKVGLSD